MIDPLEGMRGTGGAVEAAPPANSFAIFAAAAMAVIASAPLMPLAIGSLVDRGGWYLVGQVVIGSVVVTVCASMSIMTIRSAWLRVVSVGLACASTSFVAWALLGLLRRRSALQSPEAELLALGVAGLVGLCFVALQWLGAEGWRSTPIGDQSDRDSPQSGERRR